MNNLFIKRLMQRRVKFIDRKQQTRFALEVLVIMILFPLLFYILVIIPPFSKILLGKNAEVLSTLFTNQLYMIKSVWWVVLFVLVYVAILSVFMSHKIFGPIYRLTQAVQAKLNGEENIRCQLRKGDYFVDFAATLSKLLEQENNNNPNPPKDPS